MKKFNKNETIFCLTEFINIFVGIVLLNKNDNINILILLLIQELLILYNFINIEKLLYKYNER